METVKEILEKITDTWNYYFWEYKFCQDRINFTAEIKTNYYGDILSYFNDTLKSFLNIQYETEFQKSIFQAVGTLQIIYTHQDLIDELLYIFKLPISTKQDKNPNRQIRNELIGHPIRRVPKSNELISSVFFGNEFKNGTIHYILYSSDNNFSPKSFSYELDEIIDNHKMFLEKFVRLIWKRIEKILRQFQRELVKLNSLINQNIDFYKLVNFVEQRYNKIFKEDYLFKPKTLIECFERQNEHLRYKNAIGLFYDTIKEYLPETINNIEELFIEKQEPGNEILPEIIITYTASDDEIVMPKSSDHLHYEFSKLFEKHPVFGIDYFKRKFQNDKDILEELLHMEQNVDSNLEFYSSFEYLRILLTDKNYLTP